MTDPRYVKLARLLVRYSLRLKRNEKVLLDLTDIPDSFAIALMREARAIGALPVVEIRNSRVTREVLRATNEAHAELWRDIELHRMKMMDAYIAVRGAHNSNEGSDVPAKELALFSKISRPVLDHRVNKTRWVVLRWPTASMAQAAGMSTEAFEDFYFAVRNIAPAFA